MAIVPSGRRRFMVAQSDLDGLGQPAEQGLGADMAPDPGVEDVAAQAADPTAADPESVAPEQETPLVEEDPESAMDEGIPASGDDNKSVRKFVEEFYAKVLKYPPRAVIKHKEDIIERDIDSEGNISLSIKIPNEYYGKGEEFDREDVIRFAKTMKKKFNLFFLDAKDDGKTWVMNFDSRPQEDPDAVQAEMEDDALAPFFGGDSNPADNLKNKKKNNKRASKSNFNNHVAVTTQDMIADSNEGLMATMLKILAEKKK